MARGDEDIEGGLRKCLHAQRGAKWGSENIVELGEECITHSQQLPHVSCGAGALLPVLVVKGRLHKAPGPNSACRL